MSAGIDRAISFLYWIFNQTSLMKICVSQIYEKPHSSKIVFTLFNQDKFEFCVLHKWYIKRYKRANF